MGGWIAGMARAVRIEFPGALYPVTSRGNGGGDIVFDDRDRERRLKWLQRTVQQHDWRLHALALMSNHDHLQDRVDEPVAQPLRLLRAIGAKGRLRTCMRSAPGVVRLQRRLGGVPLHRRCFQHRLLRTPCQTTLRSHLGRRITSHTRSELEGSRGSVGPFSVQRSAFEVLRRILAQKGQNRLAPVLRQPVSPPSVPPHSSACWDSPARVAVGNPLAALRFHERAPLHVFSAQLRTKN